MGAIRLEWDGKSAEVPRLRLPLQTVETVNSPRADRGTLFESSGDDDGDGWRNRLIWGDNLHVREFCRRWAGERRVEAESPNAQRRGGCLKPHAISIIRKELVMLIPTDAWTALLESGVTLRPTGPAEVELVAAEGNAVAVTAVVERRPTALSPSHVRSHLLRGSPARGELLLVVPSASPATLDAAAAAGISVLVADPTGTSAVTGRIVLPDRTIELGADLPRPAAGQPPSRPGRRPWGALTVVRRLLTTGPATQVDLGRSAAVSQARVSQALSGLVADGFVRRTADAGRPHWALADWDALVDWWLAHYPGPGGITTYWYGLAGVTEQARQAVSALSAASMPVAVSGDVAADLIAPWRRPGRAVVYADPSGRPVHDELTAAGLTPSGAGEATFELIVPADPGVWPAPGTTAAEADLPLADPLQLLWDVARAPGADVDQAAAALRPVLKARATAAASR